MRELFDSETISIILLTLRMTLTSTAISALLGIPAGLLLARTRPAFWIFRFIKRFVVGLNRTLMATPPVVAGLVVWVLFRRGGPFGDLGLVLTFEGMVLAQTLLITPIICGIVYTAADRYSERIQSFAHTMGATRLQAHILTIKELSNEIYFSVATGFGRAMSEVGAIMLVGGNIRGLTRTMNTSIVMMHRQGEFEQALLFGAILMIIAFTVQMLADFLHIRERRVDENF